MNNKQPQKSQWIAVFQRGLNRIWNALTSPHPSLQELGEKRTAQFQSAVSLVYGIANLTGLLASLYTQEFRPVATLTLAGLSLAIAIGYILSRTPYFKIGAIIFVFSNIISAVPLIISAANEGRQISSGLYSVVPLGLALGFVFLSVRGLFILLILISITLSAFPYFFPQTAQEIFTDVGVISTLGIVLIIVAIFRNSVEGQRLNEVHEINRDLKELTQTLEQRVYQRTQAIQTAAEVGRRLSTILEYAVLVKEVVEELQHAFNYYHVHIYLVDKTHQNLVLSGGTGEPAKIMLANKHSIPLGRGLIGRAFGTNKIILIPDTSKDSTWLSNPLLPETRSEIAVPISFGDVVLGVLDVQHNIVDSLTQQDSDLLQLISSQIGIALRNAQFYVQSQNQVQRELQFNAVVEHIRATNTVDQALKVAIRDIGRTLNIQRTAVYLSQVSHHADDEDASRLITRQGWKVYLGNKGENLNFLYNQNEVVFTKEAEMAVLAREAMEIPLRVRDEQVGAILVDGFDKENLETSEFISLIADRLSSHLETLRLNEQTQQAFSETDALFGIIKDLNAARNYDSVLTAVRDRTILNRADLSTILFFFDRPLGGSQKPEWVIPIAWHIEFDLTLAERYPLSAFEAEPDTLFTSQINILEDIGSDKRLDRITQKFFLEVFKTKTALIVPLIIVDQMIGFILANYSMKTTFSPQDTRRLFAVAGQAAISLQGLRLLEQSLARARREQLLREITTQVNKAVDTDSVMRRAVQELGSIMQKKAFIYLGEVVVSTGKEDHHVEDSSPNVDRDSQT